MKISNTAKRLKEIMNEQNLKQVDIIEKAKPICSQFDIKLTKPDISQYLSGKVEPGQFKLMALAYALNVSELWLMGFDVPREKYKTISVSHQTFDNNILYAISVLAEQSGYDFSIFANQYQIQGKDFTFSLSQNEVNDYIYESIRQIGTITKNIIQNKLHDNIVPIRNDYPLLVPRDNVRIINYYYRLASAGTGQIVFDTPPTKRIEIPNIPEYKRVDYAIGVNGNSMEPVYHDGDTLLVEMTDEIDPGDIGIFLVDNESYVKKLGDGKLISLNPEYHDIPLTAESLCMGKVVGALP